VIDWLDESEFPLVDHTKTLTEYVPDGRLMTGNADAADKADTVAVDVDT